MIRVSVPDAQNLSPHLDSCYPDAVEPREFGLWDGFGVSDSFFEPLPADLIQAFYGK